MPPDSALLHLPEDPLKDLVNDNFLQYASYVIRERAIPQLEDGLKPVQRRILHSLYEKDDGRFNKSCKKITISISLKARL